MFWSMVDTVLWVWSYPYFVWPGGKPQKHQNPLCHNTQVLQCNLSKRSRLLPLVLLLAKYSVQSWSPVISHAMGNYLVVSTQLISSNNNSGSITNSIYMRLHLWNPVNMLQQVFFGNDCRWRKNTIAEAVVSQNCSNTYFGGLAAKAACHETCGGMRITILAQCTSERSRIDKHILNSRVENLLRDPIGDSIFWLNLHYQLLMCGTNGA